MPPKAVAGSASKGMGNDQFLMACIRNAKEKLNVDFNGVAALTGMSSGGAANKYRAIIKQLEEEDAAWTKVENNGVMKTATATATKRKVPTTTKKITPLTTDSVDEIEANEESEEEAPPKKKGPGRPPKKVTAATTKKGVATKKKAAAKAEEEESEKGEGDEA